MREVVKKTRNITKSLLGVVDIPGELLEKRRGICAGCPYNSDNKGSDELTLVERIRSRADSFCTLCGCVIKLKTTQGNEECALSSIGEEPKWGRVNIPKGDVCGIGIINHQSMGSRLTSGGTYYQFDFGDVSTIGDRLTFSFDLLPSRGVEILHTVVGCSSCSILEKMWEDGVLKCVVHLDLKYISGKFDKQIFVTYKEDDKIKTLTIKYIGHGNV